jgi:hypothetical protein
MGKSTFAAEDLSRWKKEINPAPIVAKRIKIQRINSDWWCCCPDVYHKKNLDKSDHNPSLSFYKLADGTWGFKCFSCHENGNIFQFVQAVDKVSFPKAVERVLEEAGIEGWQDGTAQDEEVSLPAGSTEAPKEHATFTLEQYNPSIQALEKSAEGQKWLAKRGISMETARRFMLGFVPNAEKIAGTNPWRDKGWVLFPTIAPGGPETIITSVKYRSLVGKRSKIAGKEVSGILRAPNTSTTLYNSRAIRPGQDVWIVEGEPDTVVLAQAGLTAVGYPMAGYNPTEEECDLLSSASRRFLAGDSDGVGNKAMEKLKTRLSGATFSIKWPNNRKDANDVLTLECANDPEKFKALVEDLRARAIQTESQLILRSASSVPLKLISWIWPGKIPFGKITLFAGNPDNGKSLASTKVAADISRGRVPGAAGLTQEPADVLMLLGEDDLEDTAVPRLMAAGADLKRIHFPEATRPVKEDDREVRLDMDIPAIERQIEANPKIRLVIIDPISNYLGDVNMMAEQEVRSILVPLKRMAEKHNIAVVIVMHLNKKNDLDAINRVGGAMAFIGVARCSWLFLRDPKPEPVEGEETPKEKKPDSFSMRRIKNNLVSATDSGLAYTVKVAPIDIPGHGPVLMPFVEWGDTVEGSADDAMGQRGRQSEPGVTRKVGRPNDALQRAIRWLSEYMQDGAGKPVKLVRADAKLIENISAETLDRAYETIGGTKAYKFGKDWYWRLNPMNETLVALKAKLEEDSEEDEDTSHIKFGDQIQ